MDHLLSESLLAQYVTFYYQKIAEPDAQALETFIKARKDEEN
jgi:hypothetical protein